MKFISDHRFITSGLIIGNKFQHPLFTNETEDITRERHSIVTMQLFNKATIR